jgi:hypothetical protein
MRKLHSFRTSHEKITLLLETIVTPENISNIRFNHTSVVQGRKREGGFILKTHNLVSQLKKKHCNAAVFFLPW